MRTISLLFIFIAATAFAQESITPKTSSTSWYGGMGIIGNTGFAINNSLQDAGIESITGVVPAVFSGLNIPFGEKVLLNIELGLGASLENKNNSGSTLIQVPVRIKGHYLAMEKRMFSISAGLNFTWLSNNLSIWSDSDVDLNNLDPEANTGYIRLKNTSYFIGPSVTVNVIDEGEIFIIFTAGYDFAISNNKWESNYADLSNNIKEKNNQFFVSFGIPF